MPKLRFIDQKISGELVRLELWYNPKTQDFSIRNIPLQIIEITDFKNSADTEKKLLENLQNAIETYHKATENEKEIILVTFSVGMNTRATKITSERGFISTIHDERFPDRFRYQNSDPSHGFMINFERYTKFSGGKDTKLYKWTRNEKGDWAKSPYYRQYNENKNEIEIEYTPERYAFFGKAAEIIREQALKIALFLNQEEETLIKSIEGNTQLLTAGEPE